ncbi:HNM1-choline permease [Fusarium sp. NRRL 52700]|nr:HNM1-choline permease [Fusarium sp. NRRL 52700]
MTDVSAADTSPVRRDIGPLRLIAIGFNIPNSWVAIAASLTTALAAGGTVSLISEPSFHAPSMPALPSRSPN